MYTAKNGSEEAQLEIPGLACVLVSHSSFNAHLLTAQMCSSMRHCLYQSPLSGRYSDF